MAQDIYTLEFTRDELLTLRVALTHATIYVREFESEHIHEVTEREHDRLWEKLIDAQLDQDRLPENPEADKEPIYDESGIVVGETSALEKDQAL